MSEHLEISAAVSFDVRMTEDLFSDRENLCWVCGGNYLLRTFRRESNAADVYCQYFRCLQAALDKLKTMSSLNQDKQEHCIVQMVPDLK